MRKRAWSLEDLRKSLERTLESVPAPSLPTLKSWSRTGALDDLDDQSLEAATRQMTQRILSGALRVRGPRKRSEQMPSWKPSDQDEVLVLLREIAQGLKTGNPNNAERGNGELEEVLLAIKQLDAIRKHVLVQFDELRQAMLSQQTATQTTNTATCGIDPLEWHRLVARVTRIENMVANIAERLAKDDETQ